MTQRKLMIGGLDIGSDYEIRQSEENPDEWLVVFCGTDIEKRGSKAVCEAWLEGFLDGFETAF